MMSKTYNVKDDIAKWLKDNHGILFNDILDACEEGLLNGDDHVHVATIKSSYGVTLLNLPSIETILESLHKSEMNFVAVEDYERAARSRDCSVAWSERKEIYKEKGLL
jgi:hypothetical protein